MSIVAVSLEAKQAAEFMRDLDLIDRLGLMDGDHGFRAFIRRDINDHTDQCRNPTSGQRIGVGRLPRLAAQLCGGDPADWEPYARAYILGDRTFGVAKAAREYVIDNRLEYVDRQRQRGGQTYQVKVAPHQPVLAGPQSAERQSA